MSLLNYHSDIPLETVRKCEKIELARQALLHGEATTATLAYARYLSACANAATISHGERGRFAPDNDEEILREWPCLAPILKTERKGTHHA